MGGVFSCDWQGEYGTNALLLNKPKPETLEVLLSSNVVVTVKAIVVKKTGNYVYQALKAML